MRLILRVDDVFDIAGRGLRLSPAIPRDLGFPIRPKDRIQLRIPTIKGIGGIWIVRDLLGRSAAQLYRLPALVAD